MDIEVTFTYNDHFRRPTLAMGLDELVLYDGPVESQFVFTVDIEPGSHQFWIRHHGKQIHETNDQHDCHLFIESIKLDGVDLDQVEYCKLTHRAKFYPVYEPTYIETCVNSGIALAEYLSPNHYLGHNGTWILDFSAPALLWIITEQNPSGMHLEDTIFSTSNTVLEDVKQFFKL